MLAILSFLLAILIIGAPTNYTDDAINPKILGGSPVKPFQYPWIASIHIQERHYCAGVLIDSYSLVTSAYCSRLNISLIQVYAHRHDLQYVRFVELGVKYKVSSITMHPLYKPGKHDIAVWKLELVEGFLEVLPEVDFTFDDGRYATEFRRLLIAGWYENSGPGFRSGSYLLQADVSVIADSVCRVYYPDMDASNLCVFSPGVGVCDYGNGGPLFIQHASGNVLLAGIIAQQSRCNQTVCNCRGDCPILITKINGHETWIRETANYHKLNFNLLV